MSWAWRIWDVAICQSMIIVLAPKGTLFFSICALHLGHMVLKPRTQQLVRPIKSNLGAGLRSQLKSSECELNRIIGPAARFRFDIPHKASLGISLRVLDVGVSENWVMSSCKDPVRVHPA